MKYHEPRYLAFLNAAIITGAYIFLFVLSVGVIFSNAFGHFYTFLALFISSAAIFMVAFSIFRYTLEKFIYSKIRLIYKSIHSVKKSWHFVQKADYWMWLLI